MNILQDFGAASRIRPRTSTDEYVDGIYELAVDPDVLTEQPYVRERMVSAAGRAA